MVEHLGQALMFHKAIFGGPKLRAWKYINYFFPNETGTFSIPDSSKKYRVIAINYCTANGTATTTDTVNVDTPTITCSNGDATVVFGYLYQDNLGDEGTGYEVRISDIPAGNTAISVTGQTVEDYYYSLAIVFQEVPGFIDTLAAKSFTATRNDAAGAGEGTITAANSAVAHWSITEAGTTALDEVGHSDGVVGNLSNNSSAMVVFYHGYGTSYSPTSAAPEFANGMFCKMRKVSGVAGVYHPEEAHIVIDPNALSNSSSYAAAVIFNGTVYNSLSELVYVTNTGYAQGDNMFAVMF
jgi:hypothetical protein